ncbi:hypothetical protein NC651_019564 [Populus alba x Populus x berolinensis]|nr:hypothetical protein NC651_019564 [Populus alba x Populus x berolinensis]
MSLNVKLYNVDGLTFFLSSGLKTEECGEDRISELADEGCNGSDFYPLSNSEKKPASSKLSLQSKWLTS